MTAEQLRNSILQQAIQGKLVPQDPADEPASVLLQCIRKEKERLVKEGKLKKKDLESKPIEEDDIPFEIPENWEWLRFKDVFVFNPRNSCDDDIDAGYIPMTYIESGLQNRFRFDVKKWKDVKSGFTHLADGDIAFAKITPCITNLKSAIMCGLPNGVAGGTTELNVFRVIGETMDRKYILYFHATPYFMNDAVYKGTAGQQRIMSDYVLNKPFPLPPLAEQRRIVAKIEELMPLVERYGKAQKELDELNAALPARLRQSILQQAISGKLVPQDENDEPASVLLDGVQKQREQLIKEKKVKAKDIASDPIGDEEKPFELPAKWEFVRLNYVAIIARGGSPRPIKEYLTDSPDGLNWIKIGDTEKGGKYINQTRERIKPEGLKKSRMIHKGDFLLTNSMSFGRPYISNIDGCIHDGWLVISPAFGEVFNKNYLYYVLSSPYARDQFLGKVSGAVVQNLNSDKVATSIIPLPPLAEQERIVAKIEELFAEIDKMSK